MQSYKLLTKNLNRCLLVVLLLWGITGCERVQSSKTAKKTSLNKTKSPGKIKKSPQNPQQTSPSNPLPAPPEGPLVPPKKFPKKKTDKKSAKQKAPKAPRIYFSQKSYEFGRAIQGEKVIKKFIFQNQGKGELRIVKLKSSCLCAAALLSKKVIPPGKKGEIQVTFKTTGLGAQYYDLYVDVYHNDPKERDAGRYVTRLRLSGRVIMLYKFTPPGGEYLGTFESKYPPTRIFRIVPLKSKGFSIKKIEYPSDKAEVTYKAEPLPGHILAQKLIIKIKKNQPPGEFLCPLKIYTTDPRQPVLFFKVFGQALGEVVYQPNYLLFGPTKRGGDRTSRTVSVFLRRGEGLKLLKVQYDRSFFLGKIEEILQGKKYEITLTLKPKAPVGPFAKTLFIYTSNPRQPLLKTTILGSLEPQLHIYPLAFYLSGQPTHSLQISLPPKGTVTLGPSKIPPGMKVKLTPLPQHKYSLSLEGRGKLRGFTGYILLKTNIPGEEEVRVPIFSSKTPWKSQKQK